MWWKSLITNLWFSSQNYHANPLKLILKNKNESNHAVILRAPSLPIVYNNVWLMPLVRALLFNVLVNAAALSLKSSLVCKRISACINLNVSMLERFVLWTFVWFFLLFCALFSIMLGCTLQAHTIRILCVLWLFSVINHRSLSLPDFAIFLDFSCYPLFSMQIWWFLYDNLVIFIYAFLFLI